jgi:hypothetical protein
MSEESDPLVVAQEIARLKERYLELVKADNKARVVLLRASEEFLGEQEIWLVLRNYDTHAETWTIMQSWPTNADNRALQAKCTFMDQKGDWWFVFHSFHHTLALATDAINWAMKDELYTRNVNKLIL